MLEGPRAVRIPVTHLAIGREWYTRALDVPPDFEDARCVIFTVGGCQLILELADHAATPATVVYWGVDQLQAELARIAAIGADPARSPPLVDTDHGTAQVSDPFGNSLGLIGIDSSNARRARHQRTAQKLALQNVRETLDQMQHKESEQKRINRVIGWAAVVVVLLAMAFAWTLASQQQRNAAALPALPIKAPGP
jgi:hypothetical protein